MKHEVSASLPEQARVVLNADDESIAGRHTHTHAHAETHTEKSCGKLFTPDKCQAHHGLSSTHTPDLVTASIQSRLAGRFFGVMWKCFFFFNSEWNHSSAGLGRGQRAVAAWGRSKTVVIQRGVRRGRGPTTSLPGTRREGCLAWYPRHR